MNLIGKIFVVVIVLMSMLFMVLSMAVYSTHKNWKVAHDELKKENTTLRTKSQKDESEHNLLVQELQRQIGVNEQEIARLQSERVALVARNEDIQTEVNELKQQRRDATAAVASTQANAERLSEENVVLQRDIIVAQEASDESFAKTVEATSQLHDAEVKLTNAETNVEELTEQVAGMTMVMREKGIDPATRVGDVKPRVEGYVSLIRRRAGDETIEVTIGSDDGIKPGHTVEVFRSSNEPGQSKWLGRAEVLTTDGDRAYARIIPGLKKGRIQEGDRVATRLN